MDDAGAMHFRQLLPDGKERSGFAAADGQMGQIMHAYLDWTLSGDDEWLRGMWPRVKKALEFAWVPGGWDANRDGVMEGVQHNTYDVEFYGPNPLCGIYYLGALRAGEEMARAAGDADSADGYRRLFENGSQLDRRQPLQRRVLRAEDPRLSEETRSRRRCAATWARRYRESRNIRWAKAAWPIS